VAAAGAAIPAGSLVTQPSCDDAVRLETASLRAG